MKSLDLHSWQVTPSEAIEIQRRLAAQISQKDGLGNPRFIVGTDVSGARRARGLAAAVVVSYPSLEVAEAQVAEVQASFPYVPGLLSFRESPLLVTVLEKLTVTPDLLIVDGQGFAHPRRMGIACHLGLLFDLPAIGCAKSILVGEHAPLGEEEGSQAELVDKDEVIGMAVRTKAGAKPVYVSVGHKISLPTAVYWVKQCCRGYRLPEPTRLAHLAAGGMAMKERSV